MVLTAFINLNIDRNETAQQNYARDIFFIGPFHHFFSSQQCCSFEFLWKKRCFSANLEEVREEWEKVKLSYEILTDKKMKQKYDRNSNVADPGAAIGRAAMSAVGWGLTSVWRMGQEAVKAGIAASTNENGDGI